MANPQKENGYTAIANELFERVIQLPIPASELRTLLFVLRKTYGFQKKQDRISLTQFEEGTGLSRPTVVTALKNLRARKILVTACLPLISLNKDWESWVVTACLLVKRNNNFGNSVLTEIGNSVLTHKRKKKTKENMKSYNEENPYEERAIDIETGEEITPVAKPTVGASMKFLLSWAEERRGQKFSTPGKQYAAFKRAKTAGIKPGQLQDRWEEMEEDKFWREKGFDWTNVVSSFDKRP